jgi:hypothetical protein
MQWYGLIIKIMTENGGGEFLKKKLPNKEASEGHHGGRWR